MSLTKNIGVGKIRLIEDWMNQHTIVVIGSYIVNKDWTIDVKGSIWLNDNKIETMPEYIKFGKIDGNFNYSGCENLVSLKGAPEEIDGSFYCEMCTQLSSLKGAPKKVHGNFNCSGCENLESLEGAPEEIDGHFVCLGTRFSEKDVRNVAKIKVKGNVYCS